MRYQAALITDAMHYSDNAMLCQIFFIFFQGALMHLFVKRSYKFHIAFLAIKFELKFFAAYQQI